MPNRVLVVDDDEQLVKLYQELLSDLGYQVDCAGELEEAQTLLDYFPYSVVITDLRLKKFGFDGFALAKYVRELSLKTRVVMLTAYGSREARAEAQALGVDAFVQKPIKFRELAQTISSLTGAEV